MNGRSRFDRGKKDLCHIVMTRNPFSFTMTMNDMGMLIVIVVFFLSWAVIGFWAAWGLVILAVLVLAGLTKIFRESEDQEY